MGFWRPGAFGGFQALKVIYYIFYLNKMRVVCAISENEQGQFEHLSFPTNPSFITDVYMLVYALDKRGRRYLDGQPKYVHFLNFWNCFLMMFYDFWEL